MSIERLKLTAIAVDFAIQPRESGLSQEHVEDIAAAYRDGADVPRPRVWKIGTTHKLSRGFHRVEAAKRAGLTDLECEVFTGTEAECIVDAAGSNNDHGMKRTNADKRRSLKMVLSVHPDWSDRRIAEAIWVSHEFVRQNRPAPASTVDTQENGSQLSTVDSSKRTGKDGKTRTAKPKKKEVNNGKADKAEAHADATAEDATHERNGRRAADDGRTEGDGGDATRGAGAEKAAPAVDAYGIPVQPHALEAWTAVPAFRDLIRQARELQRQFATIAESPGGVWLQQNGRSSWRQDRSKAGGKENAGRFVSLALANFVRDLEDSIPTYSVCPWHYADKPHPNDCTTCRGLNWSPPLLSKVDEVIADRVRGAFANV
jgi:hypothetical protein